MNEYLEGHLGHISDIEAAARREDDPHRSDVLRNYLHHAALEVTGEWEGIFARDMMVEEPRYEMRIGTEGTVVLDGADAVRKFYADAEDDVFLLVDDGDHQVFVNDSGLADFATFVEFVRGREILDDGPEKDYYGDVEIDDPSATYALTCPQAMHWPYDGDGRLVGERVYQLEPFDVSRVGPDDVPTLEEIASVTEEYLPENSDGPTPE